MIFELILLVLLCLMVVSFCLFFVTQFYNIAFRGYAPFVATRSAVIKKITDELEIKDETVVYELGAGQAGFLHAIRKKNKNAKLIGIENMFMPWLIGQIQNSFLKTRIKMMRANFFKVDISQADIIYCYLNDTTMRKLEEKLKKECKPRSLVVSYQFHLPNRQTEKEIDSGIDNNKILFYRF